MLINDIMQVIATLIIGGAIVWATYLDQYVAPKKLKKIKKSIDK